jgi:hypothetical protein
MITLTQRALDRLSRHDLASRGMAWLLSISWDRGDVEKVVSETGEVSWVRAPSKGWCVDMFADDASDLAGRSSLVQPSPGVFVQPWLLPDPPFPGGEIDDEDGRLVLRPPAA